MSINITPDKQDNAYSVLTFKVKIRNADLFKAFNRMKALNPLMPEPEITSTGRVRKGFVPMSETKWANLIEAISYFKGRRAWPPAKTTYYWEQVKNYSEANGRLYRDYGLAIINFAMRDEAKGLKPWFTWAKQQPGLFTPEDYNA